MMNYLVLLIIQKEMDFKDGLYLLLLIRNIIFILIEVYDGKRLKFRIIVIGNN